MLKYYKRLNVYKNSNGTCKLDMNNFVATSYNWWEFVKKINGRVVYNYYPYSNSTSRHQRDVLNLLFSLGISVDIKICSPRGLQNLEPAINNYKNVIIAFQKEIDNPRSHIQTNFIRAEKIKQVKKELKIVQELIKYEKR